MTSPSNTTTQKSVMYRIPSERTLESLHEMIGSRMSKMSLKNTLRGISNPYERDESEGSEDMIFELFKIPNKNEASIGKLLTVLRQLGLRDDDPRLVPMMEKIKEFEKIAEEKCSEATEQKHWKLTKEQFKECISPSIDIVSRALQTDMVIPNWVTFVEKIKKIFLECKEIRDGQVATYIPQLARMSPDLWAVSLCTVDGQRYRQWCAKVPPFRPGQALIWLTLAPNKMVQAPSLRQKLYELMMMDASFGDVKHHFCVQSVSKAFNYAIVASDLGADVVHSYVGQEPSGRLFNEICLDSTNKPHNPMVNSGAIVITSLIKNKTNMADRFDYVLNQYRRIAGNEYIGFNNATFLSERATADRNYALSYFMKENRCFPKETESLTDALDFYFQLCSVEVTCESLAVMASTLANGGVCPITNETCVAPNPCRDVLSLMYSCGMYDASGQFSFNVGLPAKSGVSGAMIVVVPNVMGICLFSPPLDTLGNSCRGVTFCKKLVSTFNFHNYDCLVHNSNMKSDPRRRDIRERDRLIPVFHVARAGDLPTMRRLYMQGEDLDASDHDDRSVLHIAATEGYEPMIKFLVNVAKVDVDKRDRWGRNALDEAKFFKHDHVAGFLEKAMKRPEQHRKDSVSSLDSDDACDDDGFPEKPSFTID